MPTNTANLNLFKYGSTDGARTFNIDEALNANWDKIDEAVAKKYTKASMGIPEIDFDGAVQAALGKARTALQSVTKADIGLGNVDNTSDASKPISTAQAAKFSEVEGALTTHKADNTAHGIGDKSMLKTTDKTTIVGAVNELFTSVSNGKNEVANAITQKGQVANGSDTFTQLATSISAINTGKKWASGLVDSWDGKVIINNLPFKPSYVFISRQMLNGTSSPSINDSTSHHYMVDVLQGGYAYNSVSTSYNSNYYGVWSKNGVSWNENTSTLTLNSVTVNVRNMNFLAIE